MGREIKEKRVEEIEYRNQEKQTPTKDQLEWDKVETYKTRNEIDQRRLELEERRLELDESKGPQKDRRNISLADHECDILNF